MLKVNECGLILVDVQGSLARMVQGSELFITNTKKLLKCCQLLSIPIIWLEQNPKGLGATIPELSELMNDSDIAYKKNNFNALFEKPIKEAVKATGRQQWLVAGIEAHICVYQTALGLIAEGFEVEVVTDCVSSRLQSNIDVALRKIQNKGACITSLEMCIFELMKGADTDHFKEVLAVIK